jgi:hypothetical protein
MTIKLNVIKRRIKHCIEKIYENDSDLFDRNNYEVTISSKLAQYLFIEFKKYDVDCEYNKHINQEKRVKELNHNIRPDIIIHRRGTDEDNLVYIEIKTDHNRESRTYDYDKVKVMTKQEGKYRYNLGLFIDFNRDKEKLKIIFFEDGKECN